MASAHFRFYAELNNFLAPSHRQRTFIHPCSRDATVKHMIEALGVPHTEVELICIDGEPADFAYRLQGGERVSVYPAFSTIDITPTLRLRPEPGTQGRFIADAHLGQLAKSLRMLGFDVLYRNDYSDAEVARIAAVEDRIVLTRDRDLLIRKEIVRGCYLHALDNEAQIAEVMLRFRLAPHVREFSRCLTCNGELHAVDKQAVAHRVPQHSRQFYEHFFQCAGCEQVYWEGSHVARMRLRIAQMLRFAVKGP
ncbi:Mut7-C RNAse domain-containing protein [Noviherbaspirillum denitrificans]|uniref:Twitching motility protein PilT n=1 Tax=Noviherbaspirillum denitrificans TaxID=1968433 RepID=A0A254TH91_9BURK|nr:Mut7-C RNAse domain-containing protein [Noviherbaspirillum denitrificans]OWW21974.1 twitching motility protein PilT [Noviherbaspirillum denitrificans]